MSRYNKIIFKDTNLKKKNYNRKQPESKLYKKQQQNELEIENMVTPCRMLVLQGGEAEVRGCPALHLMPLQVSTDKQGK